MAPQHQIDADGLPYALEKLPREPRPRNLGDKRIAGFTSEFLVLGALDPDGTVTLLRVDDAVEPGAPVS